mmetsp:Transcript_29716/g.34200  ORF Transcript_29716/g.34200 Transcript_29716/m.34200 type:complete len:216 (-) Transcript_29716:550-1197(-)
MHSMDISLNTNVHILMIIHLKFLRRREGLLDNQWLFRKHKKKSARKANVPPTCQDVLSVLITSSLVKNVNVSWKPSLIRMVRRKKTKLPPPVKRRSLMKKMLLLLKRKKKRAMLSKAPRLISKTKRKRMVLLLKNPRVRSLMKIKILKEKPKQKKRKMLKTMMVLKQIKTTSPKKKNLRQRKCQKVRNDSWHFVVLTVTNEDHTVRLMVRSDSRN